MEEPSPLITPHAIEQPTHDDGGLGTTPPELASEHATLAAVAQLLPGSQVIGDANDEPTPSRNPDLHGQYVRKRYEDNKIYWGVIEYLGAEELPFVYLVHFHDGINELMELEEIQEHLVPPETTRPKRIKSAKPSVGPT